MVALASASASSRTAGRVYRVRSRGQVTDMLAVVTGTYNVRMSMLTGAGSPDFGPIDVR